MTKNSTFTIFSILALFALISVSCSRKSDEIKLNNQRDSVSWAVGENTAIGLQKIGYDLDVDVIVRAIEHTLKGGKQPLDERSYNDLIAKLTMKLQHNIQSEQKKNIAAAEDEEAKLFEELEKNDPEVKKTPDGIYYKVLRQGKGQNVKIGEVAVFDYRGYILKDGKLIDQTYEVRDPIETLVGGNMFPGLQKGMALMNAGSIYRLYFPSKLAFGASGTDVIPPFTAIYYDVELHSFHP